MRFFTTAIIALLCVFSLQAQVVLVNSPANVEGVYQFSAALFGRPLTDSIWTADVVFVNDGSANPTQGCQAATNGVDVAGKIAFVDRGTCEFGLKCLNAQNAGAIAVVVFNSAANAGAGSIEMAAGVNGGSVTIPCVMLSYEDGQTLRAALANGAVNMTIGNVRFPNNIRSNPRTGLMNAPMGVIPAHQVDAADLFTFTPGVNVENIGLLTANNIRVTATVTHSAAGEVYNETASEASLDSDSFSLILLPEFDPYTTGQGVYTVAYSIATDSVDALPGDNAFTTDFVLSENAFCLGGWDLVNNRPAITGGTTISGGGNIEFLMPLYIGNGAGFKMDSVIFYTAVPTGSVISSITTINAFVYEWVDNNQDGGIQNDELQIVALVDNVQYQTPNAAASWVRAPLLDIESLEEGYIIPGDDRVYFVGVRYEGDQTVFFGFDNNQDYTQYLAYLGADATDLDLPYIGTNTFQTSGLPSIEDGFLFTGLRAAIATGVIVTQIPDNAEDLLSDDQLQLNVFPNPVAEVLTAKLTLDAASKQVSYRITDLNGRTIFQARKQNIQQDNAEFNVANLPAGQYFLVVSTDAGFARKAFTVQR